MTNNDLPSLEDTIAIVEKALASADKKMLTADVLEPLSACAEVLAFNYREDPKMASTFLKILDVLKDSNVQIDGESFFGANIARGIVTLCLMPMGGKGDYPISPELEKGIAVSLPALITRIAQYDPDGAIEFRRVIEKVAPNTLMSAAAIKIETDLKAAKPNEYMAKMDINKKAPHQPKLN